MEVDRIASVKSEYQEIEYKEDMFEYPAYAIIYNDEVGEFAVIDDENNVIYYAYLQYYQYLIDNEEMSVFMDLRKK